MQLLLLDDLNGGSIGNGVVNSDESMRFKVALRLLCRTRVKNERWSFR
jgi:hypothetical protein